MHTEHSMEALCVLEQRQSQDRSLQGVVSSPFAPTQTHKGTPAQNVHCIPSSTHLMKVYSFRPTNKTHQLSHVWSIEEKISSKVWWHVWADSHAQMCAENQLRDNGGIVSQSQTLPYTSLTLPHLMKKIIITRRLWKNRNRK